MRGFKIAHGRLGNQLRSARARVSRLFDQRRKVPKRVEVRELNERTVVKLATERKHLTTKPDNPQFRDYPLSGHAKMTRMIMADISRPRHG